ncbi:MAG: flagellar motor protein MotB [Magnetococcales bacterium]|nr:flagellar motor protein MotB [Magnetococcales bacterium]
MSKCPPCKKGAPAWLLTFGDMMSLLLTFFILLISMSTMDKVKFSEASGSLKDAFGIQRIQQIIPLPTGEELIAMEFQQELILVRLKEKLEVILENNTDAGEAELIALEEGFLLRMHPDLVLSPGSHTVRPEVKPMLLQIANLIKDLPNLVRVEGHTGDHAPPAPFTNNWERSASEAAAVVQFLAAEGGVDPQKLQVRGMGHTMPRVSNATPEGRNQNHRLELLISRETRPTKQPGLQEVPHSSSPSGASAAPLLPVAPQPAGHIQIPGMPVKPETVRPPSTPVP